MKRPACHAEDIPADPNCIHCAEYHFPIGVEVNFCHESRPAYGIVTGHTVSDSGKVLACVQFSVNGGPPLVRNVALEDPSLMVPFWAQEP